ncbi:alpha/beta hydrolase [Nocardia alni]|uniref:alpha/beta hydrolase n=1 Tax=Nocardia alni TaxID=2815723 RepID=UPI001C2323C0|nr:alpha/beta hydrolase [Nocardia alni]
MTDVGRVSPALRDDHLGLALDPQMRAVVEMFQQHFDEPMRVLGASEIRARRAALSRGASPTSELAAVVDLVIPGRDCGIPARHYRPQSGPAQGVVVYFHGGGWVFGGIDESDGLCRLLAGLTGCDVVSVDYRLAPEHPYPAAANDAVDAVDWVSNTIAAQAPLVVMGDSAGGNLVAAAVQHASRSERTEIVLQVLVYPVLDHRMSTASYRDRGERLLISADDMDWFWSQYVPDIAMRGEVGASPGLSADLRGLPPTIVVVAEHDPLHDEGLDYAHRLGEASVPTTVHRYDTMAHGFFSMVGALTVADDAVRAVAVAISDACRPSKP